MKLLSPSNAKRIYCILQSLFKFAVTQGYLKETPCKNIILPKKNPLEEQKQMYLTAEELPQFLSLFKDYSSFNTIYLSSALYWYAFGRMFGLTMERY